MSRREPMLCESIDQERRRERVYPPDDDRSLRRPQATISKGPQLKFPFFKVLSGQWADASAIGDAAKALLPAGTSLLQLL